MKKELFLNCEDEEQIDKSIKKLSQINPKVGNSEECGGLGVIIEHVSEKAVLFSVYRTIAYVSVKRKNGRKK